MHILVELFDREPIKNVLGASIFKPDVVVFLCDQRDSSLFKESAVFRFFKRRGMKTRPRFYYFDALSVEAVTRLLEAVVRDYPGCVFDFTGGRDIVLLAAAMFCEKHGLPAFHIDAKRGRFTNVQGCAALAERFALPRFTAEDLLAVTGATVHGHGHVVLDPIDGEMEQDVLAVFKIVMENTRAWGDFVSYLQICCAGSPAGELDMTGAKTMPGSSQLMRYNPAIFERLHEAGIFTQYAVEGKGVAFSFKSPLMKRCLMNSGIWLELYCFVMASRTHWFDEVQTSVVIDWDGVDGGADTAKNEVDLLLIKGITPVFVSCKMGLPGALALSEVKLLANKFSGTLGRAVVVCAQPLGRESRALQNRAEDLGVLLLGREALREDRLPELLIAAATYPPPAPQQHVAATRPPDWKY